LFFLFLILILLFFYGGVDFFCGYFFVCLFCFGLDCMYVHDRGILGGSGGFNVM
jgi:hypothetical protein